MDALLHRHLPWIRKQVRRRLTALLRQKGETMDYVQDVLVQFMRFAPRFVCSDEKRFRALLYRVVENALHDQYDWFTARRRAISQEKPLPSDSVLSLDAPAQGVESPSKVADRNERQAWIRLGLDLLGAEDRELIVLVQWEQLSFSEIAARIGISPDAARMRYNRAVSRLGDKVGELRRGRLPEFGE